MEVRKMDRLTWCKEQIENLQLEIANDPKYLKIYAMSAVINQMIEWMHRQDEKVKNEFVWWMMVVVMLLIALKESE